MWREACSDLEDKLLAIFAGTFLPMLCLKDGNVRIEYYFLFSTISFIMGPNYIRKFLELFSLLDFIYKWNHMVFDFSSVRTNPFLWLISLRIIPSWSIYVGTDGKILSFFKAV